MSVPMVSGQEAGGRRGHMPLDSSACGSLEEEWRWRARVQRLFFTDCFASVGRQTTTRTRTRAARSGIWAGEAGGMSTCWACGYTAGQGRVAACARWRKRVGVRRGWHSAGRQAGWTSPPCVWMRWVGGVGGKMGDWGELGCHHQCPRDHTARRAQVGCAAMWMWVTNPHLTPVPPLETRRGGAPVATGRRLDYGLTCMIEAWAPACTGWWAPHGVICFRLFTCPH